MGLPLVRPALVVVLSLGLAGCTYEGAPSQAQPAVVKTTPVAVASSTAKPALSGETVQDSFGNADFYTTVPGDTLSAVAAAYKLSEAKVAGFNGLQPGAPLTPGTRLRLIPDGPMPGAMGAATVDANGVPTSYTIEPEDSLAGITYRFNLTDEQLAEANKVAFTYEKGNVFFVRAGNHIQLQKNPVDSRSGQGKSVKNSFGQAIYYTTVDGDSFDSIGYQFRCTTDQLLRWNTTLAADRPIPAGTKVRLMPGEVTIDGAQGTFTTDADGIPLTYTTAPGDTQRQVAFRFGIPEIADLSAANRPLTGTDRVWYDFTDLSADELAPGQTISLNLTKPIHQ
ncbi:LysM peptidoglycan-binding domain-containing protein [Arthrobacter sp. B1I2]|uniref:LysM peptidoglycan-binding domain-containing protein n=1 Tax=Arthrobacter sp. B1I2 TaxID=3042263 RepID=UPI002789ACFD|nr:LysM peptidoglycan-binding domain-containing protein [Arthrobacter sp. B1I2]MDQ0733263.1 LysM repeat protein [Arthrobacter sp. B1I2]